MVLAIASSTLSPLGRPKRTSKYDTHARERSDGLYGTFQWQDLFEKPPQAFSKPFEVLYPIMARLPVEPHQQTSPKDSLATAAYLRPSASETIPGTLPFREVEPGVTYTNARLPALDDDCQALWRALHSLRPLTTDYAGNFGSPDDFVLQAPHPVAPNSDVTACPFVSSHSTTAQSALDLVRRVFNWETLTLPAEVEGRFYGVVFRSKRAPGSESTMLYEADRKAHEEAVRSGGLLMYWYGTPDASTGANLATCVWTTREDAKKASALPLHAKAAAHSRRAYASFELSRYAVVKIRGETRLRLEQWVD